jgi:uncharacterized membrane protein YeaQ/YmgE (transglycosylase-associated protein family)
MNRDAILAVRRSAAVAFENVNLASTPSAPRSFFSSVKSLVKCQTVGDTQQRLRENHGGKIMFHLIWYVLVGLIAGVIAKSVMHAHMTIFWTIVLGIIGSIIGGAVTHMFLRPTNERFHPAGLIFSTLGAILVLFICYKLKIHFPKV